MDRFGLASWIRIRIEIKSWIRIRIETLVQGLIKGGRQVYIRNTLVASLSGCRGSLGVGEVGYLTPGLNIPYLAQTGICQNSQLSRH
jgi:hypothetical protein